jgi:hypothetical protein
LAENFFLRGYNHDRKRGPQSSLIRGVPGVEKIIATGAVWALPRLQEHVSDGSEHDSDDSDSRENARLRKT